MLISIMRGALRENTCFLTSRRRVSVVPFSFELSSNLPSRPLPRPSVTRRSVMPIFDTLSPFSFFSSIYLSFPLYLSLPFLSHAHTYTHAHTSSLFLCKFLFLSLLLLLLLTQSLYSFRFTPSSSVFFFFQSLFPSSPSQLSLSFFPSFSLSLSLFSSSSRDPTIS